MINNFRIVDGVLYVDKTLFNEAQKNETIISKLTGSYYTNTFCTKPAVTTGPQSVCISYHDVDNVLIDRNPDAFVQELRSAFKHKVRGHIIITEDNVHTRDVVISNY
jgi:hypothetical protein